MTFEVPKNAEIKYSGKIHHTFIFSKTKFVKISLTVTGQPTNFVFQYDLKRSDSTLNIIAPTIDRL